MAKPREPLPDDLRTAYQVHTLAQILFARLVAAPQFQPIVQPTFPPVLH